MSQKTKSVCLCFGLITSVVILTIFALIGITGTALYVPAKRDESTYQLTMCFVKGYRLVQKTCSSQSCTGSGATYRCTTSYFSCDQQFYTVSYNISSGTTVETTFEASDGPGSNSVNQTYPCYYDSTSETSVRWQWNTSYRYLVMLCVGWSGVGVFGILTIGLIIGICYRKS
ncbi:unnamed protein product [Adineta ricciae]|uniref:Uncharacterized protein n=1 Tax=Adineta ricciae TaxID=249248 RepID=A0A814WAJ4_ADIRI|nr:unnamed protein product [Adineta ricciae]CAF1627373.1 unnamed protein product [Adineta ricciae]